MAGKNTDVEAKRAARTRRRRKQTRDEILDMACEVILRDGVGAFTLAAVAQELGLTNPALYYYFASKEALLFEMVLREMLECAADIQTAVEATETGADAIEALIRAKFDRYRTRLDMYTITFQNTSYLRLHPPTAVELERIRPFNDMMYLGAEQRLRADQKAGRFPADRNPRRFVFTAHTAAMGLLTMKAVTDASSDPLIHTDDDLVADLCRTFRQAATAGESR